MPYVDMTSAHYAALIAFDRSPEHPELGVDERMTMTRALLDWTAEPGVRKVIEQLHRTGCLATGDHRGAKITTTEVGLGKIVQYTDQLLERMFE